MHRRTLPLVLLVAIAAGRSASADPVQPERVPGPLQPWIDWVLLGHEQELCSRFLGGEEKRCAWPGVLSLDLTDKGGSFRQEWVLEANGFVPLPGEARRWPLDLRVDDRPGAAVARQGVPGLWLPAGKHTVSGSFRWDVLPESLPVSAEVGIVVLTVRGGAVLQPERDETGRVFLRGGRPVRTEEDRLDVRVQRRIVDGVPLLMTTRIELAVSGKAREVLLGKALPDGFIPLSLSGPLPARIEAGGRLRVQVRPGNWTVELDARHAGPAAAIQAPAGKEGAWAAEEVWVFEAQPGLRVVDVEGVPAVDPQQTSLPNDWKALPAYRVRAGETLRLIERRRGAANPPADRLQLHRVLWLDFDGGGYTWQDHLEGTLTRSWRLDVAPPTRLERVSIAEEDQVITHRPGSDRTGIEVRQGKISLIAEGRLPGRASIPAVGWSHDVQQASGELRLPPGWRILAALGADDAPGTWLDSWTLLDFFLVLLLALAVRYLWGNRWGALALAALVLVWHEAGAPRWIWVAVLAMEGLRRVAPAAGKAQRWIRAGSWVFLAVLALMVVAFVAGQVRQAIYPALEVPGGWGWQGRLFGLQTLAAPMEEAVTRAEGYVSSMPNAPVPIPEKRKLQEMDPRAVVSTGPGLPDWSWHTVQLRWSGPVDKDHRVRFLLVSPAAQLILTLIRLGLLVFLVLRALSSAGLRLDPRLGMSAMLVLLALLVPLGATAQELPSAEALEQLRQALLAPPDCHPECASSPRLFLEAAPGSLRLRFEVGAAAEVAVPLPGGAQQWLPTEVRVDGQPAPVVRTPDGRIWTRVEAGRHEILLTGPLPERETVQVPLPLRPQRVDVAANGWSVDGIHEDGQVDDNLQLSRMRTAGSAATGGLEPGVLPPFLEIERTLHLGLTWRLETRVVRISPPGVPVAAAVPLVPGESVTTAGIRVQKGVVQVSLGPQATEMAWASTLDPKSEIRLAAPRTLAWTEVWRLDASPIWHVDARGIPPILGPEGADVRVPEWRPWPGETVVLAVARPAGAAGQTLTVDHTNLNVNPGRRASDSTLEVLLRSSRGGRQTVTLPQGAELLSVQIDDLAQPVRQEGRDVVVPVRPGSQKIQLAWREPEGMSLFFRTPAVDLNVPSVNATVDLKVPENRWVVLAGGPRMGPAVLFWSLLVVILLAAWVLGRVPLTPLTTRDWVLLGIGLSQAPLIGAAIVAGWLLALGLRRRKGSEIPRALTFDLLQVLLVFWTVLAFGMLFWAIQQGLLGTPDMQIAGNGSFAWELRWYSDRAGEILPTGWVLSVPLLVYRLAMLAWALWLALALLRWLRWGWESFTTGGGWRRLRSSSLEEPARHDKVPSGGAPADLPPGQP